MKTKKVFASCSSLKIKFKTVFLDYSFISFLGLIPRSLLRLGFLFTFPDLFPNLFINAPRMVAVEIF